MALFSRMRSKSRKAAKEQETNASADVSKSSSGKQSFARGRSGAPSSQKPVQDVPIPSHPPRQYNYNEEQSHAAGYLEENDNSRSELHKHGHIGLQSSGDSGYGSAVQSSRAHSRTPSMHRFQREGDSLVQEEDVRPDISAFQGRDLPVQDGRYQQHLQQHMPMRPSSVPPQALRSRSERMARSQTPRSSSPGPLLQRSLSTLSLRGRSSATPNPKQPCAWFGPSSPNRGPQQSFQPHSLPSSADTAQIRHNTDETGAPFGILSGLKVNRRGLILDEEGDPIAELYEGDIIDCVRQRADAYGNVLDEYGRIVGRVRTLSAAAHEPFLRPFAPNVNDARTIQHEAISPLSQTSPNTEAPDFGNEHQQQHFSAQDARLPAQCTITKAMPVPSTLASVGGSQHTFKPDERLGVRADNNPKNFDASRQKHSPVSIEEHEPHAPCQSASSISRSESLPSVPESDGASEILLSDNSSQTSEEQDGADAAYQKKSADGFLSTKEKLGSQSQNDRQVQLTTMQEPMPNAVVENHSTIDEELPAADVAGQKSQNPPGVETEAHISKASQAPTLGRSISARVPTSTGVASVTVIPRNVMGSKKPIMRSDSDITTSFHGLHATPNRVKSPPLPSFPGRGLGNGAPGGNAFAKAPILSVPARRLMAPGSPASPAFGAAGVNMYPPPVKPRSSNSMPMIRSPLSSHGITPLPLDFVNRDTTNTLCSATTPPDSDQGSVTGEIKTASVQPQGVSTSRSVKTIDTAAKTTVPIKARKVFSHANKVASEKDADVFVKELVEDKKLDKKKKGVRGLFSRKK
ncbi:hypothetical protein Q7P37_008005 [Cladosporium fusiforme]